MQNSQINKQYLSLLIFIISFLSLIFAVLTGEDSLGGARHDYYTYEKYIFNFSNDFENTFNQYGDHRNSPVFYIIFSFFYKLGLEASYFKFLNFIVIIPLSIFLIKCIEVKYKKVSFETKLIILSIIFISPTVRSILAWPYPLIWAICFFLISIYYFLKFNYSNKKKEKFIYSLLNVLFLAISSYLTPNFSIFAIYFFLFFFKEFKKDNKIYFIILENFILALPAIYFIITKDFYLFKDEVYDIPNTVKYNLSNKIIIITTIIIFFFIPFINFSKLKNKIKNLLKINIINLIIFSFFIINILLFNFLPGAGGGIFYHLSNKIIGNSSILFVTFAISLLIFRIYKLYNFNNIFLFIILVIYNLQFTIYYKYFDPITIFIFLFLLKFTEKFELKEITKKYLILYIFFLVLNIFKKSIIY